MTPASLAPTMPKHSHTVGQHGNSVVEGFAAQGLSGRRCAGNSRAVMPGASVATLVMALSLAWALPTEAREPRAQPAGQQTTPYVTRKGDTLYDIAARYLRDSGDWRTLARLNHVGTPGHLQPGVTLRLPVALLREERVAATVVATSGPVERAYGNGGYTALAIGMKLTEGDRIRTGHNGFVTLELEDGSHVSVPQDSSIGLDRLRQTVFTGSTDRLIRLERGEVDNEVTHATKKDSRFQIRSPSVVAGVRGTRFRVNYDAGTQVSAVEVLDGAVGVDAAGATPPPAGAPLAASAQLVKAKFGSVTRAGAAAGAPLALLAEPSLLQPGKIQDAPDVAFDLVPLDGARSYRVQVGRDAGLLDVIRDQRVDTPHATFGDLSDGTYFVRISAIDANGLEGLPRTYAFERRQFSLTTSATARADSHDYVFRWLTGRPDVATRYRLVLATTPDLARPLVDQTDVTGAEVVIQNLPRGVYYWTVIAEQFEHGRFYQQASAVQSFTLTW